VLDGGSAEVRDDGGGREYIVFLMSGCVDIRL